MAPRRLLVLLALVIVAVVAVPAAAHTQIQRATPGPGETVAAPVASVVLEFLDPVMPTPVITVSGPAGQPVAGLQDAVQTTDDVARADFEPLTEAGTYQVDYTFVALDGATQEGAHQFTVEPDDGAQVDVRSLLPWAVGAVLVALVVAALLGRRRSAA